MDEPCSALDPISTAKIEDLILELAKSKTVVIVTHNLQQAERVSDNTAFFMYGELIEMLPSREMFSAPQRAATRDYVSGVFG
jgi:phosphate transport system ATP-binding protein